MTIAGSQFRGWLMAVGVSFGTALLVVTVFFLLGNPWNGDIVFHATSWLDVANQWREGIIYPRWMEWANSGFGEPRFIFYPPLSWIIGAALTFMIPWKFVPSVFVVIARAFAGLGSYALGRRILSEKAALLAAAFFAANPYALLDIYNRGALAEDLACALIPLVILASLNLCELVENRWRSLTRASAFFAVAFASVWLSDVPAAIMTTYSAAFIFVYAAVLRKSFQPLLRGALGLAAGFGLDSFNLLPVLYEQHWASVERLLPAKDLLGAGNMLSNNFIFFRDSNPLSIDWIASDLVILLLVTTGIAAIWAYRRGVEQSHAHRCSKVLFRMAVLLAALATFLMTRPSWIFWKYLPKLLVMQFPWRWIGVLVVPYALLLGDTIGRRRRAWVWGGASLVIVGVASTLLVLHGGRYKKNLGDLQTAIQNDRGFKGASEYLPSQSDYRTLALDLFNRSGIVPRVQTLPVGLQGRVPNVDVRIEKWTAEERTLEVTSQEPSQLALRILNYPAWQIEINGKAATSQHLNAFAQIVAQVQAGRSQIRIRFAHTPDRMLGNMLSATSLLAILAALCQGKIKLKCRQEQNSFSDIRRHTVAKA